MSEPSAPTSAPRGWECPKCGTVHAPWVASCRCHGGTPSSPALPPIGLPGSGPGRTLPRPTAPGVPYTPYTPVTLTDFSPPVVPIGRGRDGADSDPLTRHVLRMTEAAIEDAVTDPGALIGEEESRGVTLTRQPLPVDSPSAPSGPDTVHSDPTP